MPRVTRTLASFYTLSQMDGQEIIRHRSIDDLSLHVAYVGQWFLVAFVAASFLGQLVVVALSVPDSLLAFTVAFLVQLVVSVLGAVQGFLAISSDDHSRVYVVIRLLAVPPSSSLAEISHDLLRVYYVGRS